MNIVDLLIAAAAAHFATYLDLLETHSLTEAPPSPSVLAAMEFLVETGMAINEHGGVSPITPEDVQANEAFALAWALGRRGPGVKVDI